MSENGPLGSGQAHTVDDLIFASATELAAAIRVGKVAAQVLVETLLERIKVINPQITVPFSLTGYPCVVVRVNTAADHVPIGVQVVARPWREDVALVLARILEQEFGGWRRPPL